MHASPSPSEITVLLRRWSSGDEEALERLVPLIYEDLRKVAHRRLTNEGDGHTLRTTALVHEAYARIAANSPEWNDRRHFFALAAKTMRRVLVDYARARLTEKRGGGAERVSLDDLTVDLCADGEEEGVLELNRALDKLEVQDPRKARVVEARVFAGLTGVETAEALGISPATVDRDMRVARAWLARELS